MKIIADKDIPFLQGVAEHFGEVEYIAGIDFSNARIQDAEVLITRTVARMDEAMLKGTNVKLICSATAGFDHIDTAYCDANDIAWRNAPGCNSSSVEQYITSSLLILSARHKFDLKGKTIGVVGVGHVGKKVAAACEVLGMNVLLNDPPRRRQEPDNESLVLIDEIKEKSDFITYHTPLTKEGIDETYHMVDERFLSSLGKKPFIINAARGGIVDTQAMKLAIKTKKVAGVVVDCWESEPYIDLEYMEMADIATPHIAGYSADGKANATRMALTALADFYGLDKEPIKAVTPPLPPKKMIDLDSFSSNNRVFEAILETYNPMTDHERLVGSPDSFRQLRNNYPLRREYPAYIVVNADENERRILNKLDFKLG
ncbi:4-phosphoerythronate dehydrogenase [Dysgonomonas sp. 25]|uniref:4-phosphoerythronate dehydrogenase n=1 Tax=Dysgonomonas sp. 25 TaxID=2302933 RepID=UPI0013D45414|nr:4-phosphoerythronate dehydrogenase [Dysgonomonas sp. 25]NDV68063.1 4-phosphoerythronate dehydrogenase [Dysgonomonas sp. 25]